MITDGLRTAAQALHYWQRRQEVLANNLANVETGGFKGQRVFARLLEGGGPAPRAGTDFRPGTLVPTGRPLDVALEGPGFLVVRTVAGERLIRGGSLRLDEAGRLVDGGGNPLLGERGPLSVPPGSVSIEIDAEGNVRADELDVDRLRVEVLAPGVEPTREGGLLLAAADDVRRPLPAADRRVRQGMLEQSNVDAIGALVEMITIQRSYAAVEKTIGVMDQVMDTVANQVGRVS